MLYIEKWKPTREKKPIDMQEVTSSLWASTINNDDDRAKDVAIENCGDQERIMCCFLLNYGSKDHFNK